MAGGIRSYSTTPANNNASPPFGWPEGQPPSSVNNAARQMMADIRAGFEDLPWFDFGDVPTRVDNDTITVPTDLTARYVAGRRIKIVGATTGYATISSSSYSAPDTTINVTMDSGNVPATLVTVSLGPEISTGAAVPYFARTAAEIAAGVTPTNYAYLPGNALRYGCIGDGSTDDTSAAQLAVNANKGSKVTFPAGYSFKIGTASTQLLLDGPTYNGTELVFDGELKLATRASAATFNFQSGAFVGLAIRDCDRVTVRGNFNGNRSVQPDEEHIYCGIICGATNTKLIDIVCREIRGDGFYVSQKDILSNSTNSDGLNVSNFLAENTADDGRNGLSIISCDNGVINGFRTNKVGGTINSAVMPGGLDIEPDQTYQSCKHWVINGVEVVTAGTGGLNIQGRTGTVVTQDVTVNGAVVTNTCAATLGSGDVPGVNSQTNNHTLLIYNVTDVTVDGYRGRFTNAYGDAVIVSNSDFVKVDGQVSHVRTGARIGNDAPDSANGVRYSDINLLVTDTARFGFQVGKITQTKVRGKVQLPAAGFYTSSTFGVQAILYTQTDSQYSVDVVSDALWIRSYRADASTPPTFTRTYISNCDLQGTTWAAELNRVGDTQVLRYDVRGVTDQAAIPAAGSWAQGTFVTNTAMALAAGKVTLGWSRLTTGAANVLNTDWAPAVCPNA